MFKFSIGDWVRTVNGVMVGIVEERIYHDYPCGVRVKYYVWGRRNDVRFSGARLFEEMEDNLVAADKPHDWEVPWRVLTKGTILIPDPRSGPQTPMPGDTRPPHIVAGPQSVEESRT